MDSPCPMVWAYVGTSGHLHNRCSHPLLLALEWSSDSGCSVFVRRNAPLLAYGSSNYGKVDSTEVPP
ncbi:hypothetical protein KFK09_025464 [Dendrobium nobile]|uniref:Uncharacterized protein n=1 Tax=Dendrobium nobile TaxID=94219 RepID=A0A8T3AGW8_DENNO|nr:hypothetical protein KFK09_025464 [Dendrobium nobile]